MAIESSAFAAALDAAKPLFPKTPLSPAMQQGFIGDMARAVRDIPTWGDLENLLLPGLAAMGVLARLLPLPDDDDALFLLLRERLQHGVQIPLFAFAEKAPILEAVETAPDEEEAEASDIADAERAITRQGVVISLHETEIRVAEGMAPPSARTAETLRAAYSRLLRLQRAPTKGGRRDNLRAALLRWLAFSAAYPQRTPTLAPEDAPRLALSAEFLFEIAGRQRAPYPLRLRRAAELFQSAASHADIERARGLLREAVLLDLRLPVVVQNALLSSPATPLHDLERRELIYLARAGTLCIKTLAARRLVPERHHADVRRTLEQLAYSPHAWIRAAAQKDEG